MKSYKQSGAVAQYNLKNTEDIPQMAALCDALGNETRLKILRRLQSEPYAMQISALGRELGIPTTTLLYHLEKMEKAELVRVYYKSTSHGTQKIVVRDLRGADLRFYFSMRRGRSHSEKFTQSMGVGQFTEFFGSDFNFCTAEKRYVNLNDNCYHPERFAAELVYTTNGIISYRFSNQVAKFHKVNELSVSLELCSEAPYFDNNYLSDITFWINGTEICTYTSLGDFGDHRGLCNPQWWRSVDTQHGVIVTITVDDDGVYINGEETMSKANLKKLHLEKGNCIELKFGNKPTATNLGGFNVFGKRFGDYPQDISLALSYDSD